MQAEITTKFDPDYLLTLGTTSIDVVCHNGERYEIIATTDHCWRDEIDLLCDMPELTKTVVVAPLLGWGRYEYVVKIYDADGIMRFCDFIC